MQPQLAPDYPRTYRPSIDWFIMSFLIGGICAGAGLLGAWYFASGRDSTVKGPTAVFFTALCLALVTLGGYLIYSILRSRVVLSTDSIEIQTISRATFIRREELSGWRILQPSKGSPILVLSFHDPLRKPFKVQQYFALDDAFRAWLAPLIDFDEQERLAAEKEIADNEALGLTPDERMRKLAGAHRLGGFLTVVTIAACIWVFLYPRPYSLAVTVLGLLPWTAVAVTARSHGLFRIDQRRKDPHPSVALPFLMPGFVLMLRAMTDLNFLRWQPLLWTSLVIAAVLWFAAYKSDASIRAKRSTAIILLVLLPSYGFGAFALSNALLDKSPATPYTVRVLDKYISSGRSKSYHLKLDAWGPKTEPDSVDVTRRFYDATARGSQVCISLHSGAFRVPWYVVRRCPNQP